MKKIIVTALLTASLMMPFTVNANKTVMWKTKISGKEYYATNLIVKKVDHKHNKVYAKNWYGIIYPFSGVNDLEKGDVIACIMWTKGTKSIKDDAVITAKFERTDLIK